MMHDALVQHFSLISQPAFLVTPFWKVLFHFPNRLRTLQAFYPLKLKSYIQETNCTILYNRRILNLILFVYSK